MVYNTYNICSLVYGILSGPWLLLIVGLPIFIAWHHYVFVNDKPWSYYLSKIPFPKWMGMWNEWTHPEYSSISYKLSKDVEPNGDYFYAHAFAFMILSAVLAVMLPFIPIVMVYAVIPAVTFYLLTMKLPRTLVVLGRKVSLLFKHVDKEEPKY